MIKTTFKWIGNILLGLLIFIVVFSVISSFRAMKNPSYIPSIMGYRTMTVLTGSMKPVLDPGDLIITKNISPNKVKVDDVITFKIDQNTLVTHRVVKVINENNEIFYKTKGDSNNTEDHEVVSQSQLIGKLVLTIPKGGYIAKFVKTPKGLILLIILPAILLIGGELKYISSNLAEHKDQDKRKNDSA